MMTQLSKDAQNLNWLVNTFVRGTPGVAHAIVVSSDGLLIAVSERLDRARADQLAAVASGMASLTAGASRLLEAGEVNQTVIEMERGFLFVMTIGDGVVSDNVLEMLFCRPLVDCGAKKDATSSSANSSTGSHSHRKFNLSVVVE